MIIINYRVLSAEEFYLFYVQDKKIIHILCINAECQIGLSQSLAPPCNRPVQSYQVIQEAW